VLAAQQGEPPVDGELAIPRFELPQAELRPAGVTTRCSRHRLGFKLHLQAVERRMKLIPQQRIRAQRQRDGNRRTARCDGKVVGDASRFAAFRLGHIERCGRENDLAAPGNFAGVADGNIHGRGLPGHIRGHARLLNPNRFVSFEMQIAQ